jgi:hypothetical protein
MLRLVRYGVRINETRSVIDRDIYSNLSRHRPSVIMESGDQFRAPVQWRRPPRERLNSSSLPVRDFHYAVRKPLLSEDALIG